MSPEDKNLVMRLRTVGPSGYAMTEAAHAMERMDRTSERRLNALREIATQWSAATVTLNGKKYTVKAWIEMRLGEEL